MAAIVLIPASPHRSGGGPGPLIALVDGREGIAQPAAVGQAISASDLIVRNTGDDALVLDRVRIVGLPKDIYRGAYVVPFPLHAIPFTTALTYRVPRGGHLLPGVTVAPHTKAWIVVGLTLKRGQHQWTRVDLDYHDGAAVYRRHVAIAGAVCAPLKQYLGNCHAPGF